MHAADARSLFEHAVALEPDYALPWLWLATATDRPEVIDARINMALDLDLGGPEWRMACGELLIVLGLRRLPGRPERARAILIEASYALPSDARVWVAMAASTGTVSARLAYLERAVELANVEPDAIRAELVSALVTLASELLEEPRRDAARDTLLRAASWAPHDQRLWAIAALLASVGDADAITRRALAANAGAPGFAGRLRSVLARPGRWWVRARRPRGEGLTDRDAEAHALLAELRHDVDAQCHVVQAFRSQRISTDLLRSAADLTARLAGAAATAPRPPHPSQPAV